MKWEDMRSSDNVEERSGGGGPGFGGSGIKLGGGAIIVVANIPFALFAAVALLWATGQSINVMTLGGLALAVGVLVVYQLGYLRLTATSQESYNVSVSARVATLMRVGLGDHIHCSVFRKYPKNAPPIEKLEGNLGPEYRGLIPIVKQNVPEDYRLMIGHQCRYHGRRFVHLSFKNDSHLLSLVIAKKGEGESFEAQGLLPALVQSGIPVYQSGVQRFAIDAFETHGFLVYFISDLPREQNAAMMIAMAPSVRQLLEKL